MIITIVVAASSCQIIIVAVISLSVMPTFPLDPSLTIDISFDDFLWEDCSTSNQDLKIDVRDVVSLNDVLTNDKHTELPGD